MSRRVNIFDYPDWLRIPESWIEPPKPAEPAPKPKREKPAWRTMSPIEREAALALSACRFLPGSCEKRFARQIGYQAEMDATRITDKQAALLWKLVVRYRKQIGSDRLECHARKEIDK